MIMLVSGTTAQMYNSYVKIKTDDNGSITITK